ncbi:unnamed protein product [Litomosoides sigmodontis]|uniref:Uncharacterized protein n=1 Tax=Litomosoides sigmodontis TaxID=42156 RepID=A0A3P6S5W0_LITSI|nr:unnamed protein product [Litomosoides sigmodontis]
MASEYCSFMASEERHSLKMIRYSRFLQMGLAVLILLSLASAHSVPTNRLLWLIALATLSGSIFSHCAYYYFPSLLVKEMNYLYVYDLMMTICAAVCVPLSTYCTTYQAEGDSSSTSYVFLALLCIFLATSFLFSLLIRCDFEPYGRRPTSEASKSDEHRSLLSTYADYNNYQAF